MIIDAHTHIFPETVRRDRRRYFDGEPAFRLLYESPQSRLAGAEDLIAVMDENGIDKAVTFGFPWENPETAKRHNDYILSAQQDYPGRLIGLGCMGMYTPEAAAEAERCLTAGLQGIGELAFYQAGLDRDALDRLSPIMALCRENDKPVLIHTNEPVGHVYPGKTPNTLKQIYDLAAAFPENRIVLAHWGGGIFFFNLLKKEAKTVLRNIWLDTAASPFLYDPGIYALACQLAGPEKVLFGTDYPLLPPGRYYAELKEAGLTPQEKSAIMGDSAGRVYLPDGKRPLAVEQGAPLPADR